MTPEEQRKAFQATGVKSNPAKPGKMKTKVSRTKTQETEASEPHDDIETPKRSRSMSHTASDKKLGPLQRTDFDPMVSEFDTIRYSWTTLPHHKPRGKKRVTAAYRISSDLIMLETSFK
jgi:hypothetical protein